MVIFVSSDSIFVIVFAGRDSRRAILWMESLAQRRMAVEVPMPKKERRAVWKDGLLVYDWRKEGGDGYFDETVFRDVGTEDEDHCGLYAVMLVLWFEKTIQYRRFASVDK